MDFKLLTTSGNIAFYESCEVTEIFIHRKSDKINFNFYTLVVFEEKPYLGNYPDYLGEMINVPNSDLRIGIKRYWLNMEEIETRFKNLKEQNKWIDKESELQMIPQLKYLPKQYIPATQDNRINHILKNNYHTGSYCIEFFDETKSNFNNLLDIEYLTKFNDICKQINKKIPIDFSVARDRIGNFIFQFPITLLETNSSALASWDGIDMTFSWHHGYIQNPPDCLVQVETTIGQNYIGAIIEKYNKTNTQKIIIGNLDQKCHIKIWRENPSLILSSSYRSYLKKQDLSIEVNIISAKQRIFEVDGNTQKIDIESSDSKSNTNKKISYISYINSNLYDIEKEELKKSLSFKQYKKVHLNDALADILELIKKNDKNGVYLWDPYLRAKDIFRTLYYSKSSNVPLRAIAMTSSKTEKTLDDSCNSTKPQDKNNTPTTIIREQRKLFENNKNNNHGLNFEFRMQYGQKTEKFHDRFLIFPSGKNEKAKVYSLGTSLNSFGSDYNILQLVSHPQLIVDAFNELWDSLNHSDYLVWKNPSC